MGEDLSTGIKMAIILVILAALLASVFSILTISKNMTNQSVDELQSSLYAFQNMRWEDYNLRTISGNEVQVVVRSAVDNNIAVVVNTERYDTASVLYGVPLSGFDKKTGSSYNIGECSTSDSTRKQIWEGTTISPSGTTTGTTLHFDTNKSCFVGEYPIITTDDSFTSNRFSYTGFISNTESPYYINPTLKFKAYVIRDTSDAPIGILFDQVRKE